MTSTNMTWTVRALTAAVGDAVREAFPTEIWVTGEIHDLSRPSSGHVYYTLTEADDDGGPGARLRVMLRSSHKTRVNRLLTRSGSTVRMTDGTAVRIRGLLDVYGPQGQLQLQMRSIDPAFTLGQLAVARAELLAKLDAEGLLAANAARTLAADPLRVAIVTSGAGDAIADAARTLEASGFAFEIALVDVPVQGPFAAAAIAAAIAQARPSAHDVVLVVRGGGATSDLAAFDDEAVARAIAACALPVVTGIGHEQDRSVADDVAHTAARTPTGAAQVLVDRLTDAWGRVEALSTTIAARALERTDREHHRLDATSHTIRRLAETRVSGARRSLDSTGHRIGHAAERSVTTSARHLDDAAARTVAGGRRASEREHARLTLADAQLRLADPAQMLRRGWSITRTADGTVVRSAADVAVDTTLVTTVADGTVTSSVTHSTPTSPTQQDPP